MKIGLIGNMNNNNFALLRYFRDLGADAHLLLYADDGTGSLAHFAPEADTWQIEKWAPFIHRTSLKNDAVCALHPIFSWMLAAKSALQMNWRDTKRHINPLSAAELHKLLAPFDKLVGSGITPAMLQKINRTLDIFYPYSTNVEYLYTAEFINRIENSDVITKRMLQNVQKRQAQGIRASRHALSADPGLTFESLVQIGANAKQFAIPMVYVETETSGVPADPFLNGVIQKMQAQDLSIFHHARNIWGNRNGYPDEIWRNENKNTDWLIHGFASLLSERPHIRSHLFILEYGPDVDLSKALINELGIAKHVTWLALMPRKSLMSLLSHASLGVGQFYEIPAMIWGGTGWETLASGKPLLQGFQFEPGQFERQFGYPPPPMLPVSKREDLIKQLLFAADQPQALQAIGHEARSWFNQFNGRTLAQSWLTFLANDPSTKATPRSRTQKLRRYDKSQ